MERSKARLLYGFDEPKEPITREAESGVEEVRS